jgi:hypothetical protein
MPSHVLYYHVLYYHVVVVPALLSRRVDSGPHAFPSTIPLSDPGRPWLSYLCDLSFVGNMTCIASPADIDPGKCIGVLLSYPACGATAMKGRRNTGVCSYLSISLSSP